MVSQAPTIPDPHIAPPRYRVAGAGPLLIYNAGIDGTGELFFKQANELESSFRVVTFRSRERGQFTYDDLTGDVASIIHDQGESQAIILGESFGGTVALSFALRYPRMTRRLVVINSFPRLRRRAQIRFGVTLTSWLPFRLLWPVRRTASVVGLFVDRVSPEDRNAFWKAVSSVSAEGYARRLQLIAEFDVENRLSEIQAPTLFIAGDRDLLVPSVKEAQIMCARMPNATVRVIRGAGHACLLGDRVRLAELLAE
ncbi:MAG TPA: alpha/beta hydrolase [Blastocatellia bacterium]|nr:alpha/beta hydrolase [Blastocatellia bacterium]